MALVKIKSKYYHYFNIWFAGRPWTIYCGHGEQGQKNEDFIRRSTKEHRLAWLAFRRAVDSPGPPAGGPTGRRHREDRRI